MEPPAQISDIEVYFARFVPLTIGAAGIVIFFMMIRAGFNLLGSNGDPGKVSASWKTITYAVIGFAVLLASVVILNFLSYLIKVDLTQFKISL